VSHLRRLPNGRYQARYRGPDGRERARNFRRKSDAQAFLTGAEAAKLRGDWIDPRLGRKKLDELWAEVERNLASRVRPTTIELYRGLWRLYIGPAMGGSPVGAITRTDVEELLRHMEAKGVGPASIGATLRLLHRVLEAAVAEGLVPANRAHRVKPPALPHKQMRFLTPEEVERLVEATPERWKAFVMLAAWGGLRFGEIAALRTDRVDVRRSQVRVEETLSEVAGYLHTGPTKTKAKRSVALPSFVMDAIAAHQQPWPDEPRYLFTAPEGGLVRRSNFRNRVWLPAIEKAGVAPLRIHDLRHTAVALAIAAGAHAKAIQARLGHSSVAMTLDRYGHLMEGLDAQVAARLESLRRPASTPSGGFSADCQRTKSETTGPESRIDAE
jgi:integrase